MFQLVVCMGECTQIFGIGFGGGCKKRCRPRYRLMFSWSCVWVSVRRFFGLVLGELTGCSLCILP